MTTRSYAFLLALLLLAPLAAAAQTPRLVVELEGGADVTSVYNFAWLHYAVLSLTWRR